MIGALIGAAGSLLGGLFGSKKKKEETKTVTESTVDYQKMSANAEAAGFNPLTALRNGGAAGFSTTTGTTTAPTTSALGGVLQSVGGTLGQAFGDMIDPVKKKERQLDTALVDYQLRQLKQGPQMPGRLYPGGTFTGTKVRASVPSVGKAAKFSPGQASYGPQLPPGAGKDGEILPAVVAWKRSDGSMMYTYNPDFPDGDAQVAGAVADGGGRFWDQAPYNPFTAPPSSRGGAKISTRTGRYQHTPPLLSAPSGQGRWGRYDR